MTKIFLLILATMLVACQGDTSKSTESQASGAHSEAVAEEPEKGPHRGRMLRDDGFAIELAIFEDGVPPEYHAWPTQDGQPVPLNEVQLVVELSRLGGKVDRFAFKPDGDFLRGDGVVTEPHSFAVKVTATRGGKTSTWSYDSFEGRTTIPAKIAEGAGIRTGKVGPATLTETVKLYGRIVANRERQREISARYPGLIRSVKKGLGDAVQSGEVLATIEANDSLREYTLTAPLAGVITARDANAGEQTGSRVLFTVTDPSAVMAELAVFPRDRARVQPGAAVTLRLADAQATATGRVARIAPQVGANQSVVARVPIESDASTFLPGSLITADVAVGARDVPLAVKTAGLQPCRDFTVVYAQVGETYEVRMLELGGEYGEWTEVLGGIDPGETYVSEGSFVIKADIEKSGASHDH
jgi:membrane fusion protein, heavy metal efflux system